MMVMMTMFIIIMMIITSLLKCYDRCVHCAIQANISIETAWKTETSRLDTTDL